MFLSSIKGFISKKENYVTYMCCGTKKKELKYVSENFKYQLSALSG